MNIERVKLRDLEALNNMNMALQRANPQLQDVEHCTTLNSLAKLIAKLPENLQTSWIKHSFKMCKETGSRASFVDFVDFIQDQSHMASSDFGELQWTLRTRTEFRPAAQRKKVSVFAASSKR